jgi:hypothetical protein
MTLRKQEFPNDEAARQEAAAVARDLSRNRNVATDERLMVTDASGNVVHLVYFFPKGKVLSPFFGLKDSTLIQWHATKPAD